MNISIAQYDPALLRVFGAGRQFGGTLHQTALVSIDTHLNKLQKGYWGKEEQDLADKWISKLQKLKERIQP